MILTGGLVKAIVYRRLGSPADSPSATWNLRPTGGICPTTDVCISVDTARPGALSASHFGEAVTIPRA